MGWGLIGLPPRFVAMDDAPAGGFLAPEEGDGVGKSDMADDLVSSAGNSSRMISLHRSMHSSQMNTDGPAISFFTSCWLLPQNEQ